MYVGTGAYYLLIHSALHVHVLAVEYFCMSIYYLLLEDSLFDRFLGGGGSVIYVGLVMWGRGEAVGVDGNIPPTGMRFLRQVAGTFVKRLESPRLIR